MNDKTDCAPTVETITKLMDTLDANLIGVLKGFSQALGGIRIMQDPTGSMCLPNEICLIAGPRIFAKLSGKSEAECCNWKGEGDGAE